MSAKKLGALFAAILLLGGVSGAFAINAVRGDTTAHAAPSAPSVGSLIATFTDSGQFSADQEKIVSDGKVDQAEQRALDSALVGCIESTPGLTAFANGLGGVQIEGSDAVSREVGRQTLRDCYAKVYGPLQFVIAEQNRN